MGALLVVHGVIHAIGPIDIWGIADVRELGGDPSFNIGSSEALAGVWLIPVVMLVAAGSAVLARRAWWRPLAIGGVIVSQAVIILWWGDAAAGTVANLLVVAAVVLAGRLGLGSRQGREPR